MEVIYDTALKCRAFEQEVRKHDIKVPIYLSIGEELIPASLSYYYRNDKLNIFAQHRCHSIYLSFGGDPVLLAKELLGHLDGCTRGRGGSASIHFQNEQYKMFGHSGLMGDQIPIAVGYCMATKERTLAIMGDASAEEDYVLASLGFAATHKLPITFIVEDNNLSILTEIKVRRSWKIHEVAKSFGLSSVDIEENPEDILKALNELPEPRLINIRYNRICWHAGKELNDNVPDKLKLLTNNLDKYTDQAKLIWINAKNESI